MTDTFPLRAAEARAVRHILERSALADCPGTASRVFLVDGPYLVLEDVASWPWSSGELVLIQVIRWIVGASRLPDLNVDDANRLVVREALRYLAEGEARAEARLLKAVEQA